jgi:hypothetical protein
MTSIRLPPHVEEGMHFFSGRTWLLPIIQDWYEHSSKRLLLITGMPGTGKSMVAAWLAGYGKLPKAMADKAALQGLRRKITAAFFCRADTYENSPMECGNQLARQAVRKLPREFAEALTNLGGKRIQIVYKKVESGARTTGVIVKRLDLSGLLDEPAFDLALLKPLREMEDSGLEVPALFLVDALDEGGLYTGRFKIHQAVKKLAELNTQTRVIATLRSKADELQYFENAERIDLIEDAPKENGVSTDIRAYVEARLARSHGNGSMHELKDQLLKNAGGYFLFAHLVLEDLLSRLAKGEQLFLDDVPDALSDHYHRFLLRLRDQQNRSWENELRPALGVLAVAQGEGLTRTAIAKFTHRDLVATLDTLQSFKQYLVGIFDQGPFRLFHQSFAEYLLEEQKNSGRLIEAFDAHTRIVEYFWPSALESPEVEDWDEYGSSFMPVHLAGASQTPDDEESVRLARRLMQLVVDPVLTKKKDREISDTARVERELSLALKTACDLSSLRGLPFVFKVAKGWWLFRVNQLQPDQMMSDASAGRIDQALRRLPLYGLDRRWEKAVRLILAWSALDKNEAGGKKAFEAVSIHHPFPMPLPVLRDRILHALGGDLPDLVPLPPEPTREDIEELIRRLSAYKPRKFAEGYYGEPGYDGYLAESIDIHIGNIPAYITQNDAPFLVAYARNNPEEGTEAFRTYTRLHAVNQYREYRSIQFWLLFDAIIRHPDPEWVLPRLGELVVEFLSGQEAIFEEAFQLVNLALQANAGSTAAFESLEKQRKIAEKNAGSLEDLRGRGDIWGEHKRRISALALAYASISTDSGIVPPENWKIVRNLIDLAKVIPRGYAGLMVPAWLNLAETAFICTPGEYSSLIQTSLQEALETVHKINDPLFCARATARVNAMLYRWWPFPAERDLEATLLDFAQNPRQGIYSPFHLVQTEYTYRNQEASGSFPMGAFVLEWHLEGIAEMFKIPLEELLSINPALAKKPEAKLEKGTEVNLPDPEFAPLLASRLAAEVAGSELGEKKKRSLIQALVPVALPNRTALDAVLGRLLFVSRPKQAVLEELNGLFVGD